MLAAEIEKLAQMIFIDYLSERDKLATSQFIMALINEKIKKFLSFRDFVRTTITRIPKIEVDYISRRKTNQN